MAQSDGGGDPEGGNGAADKTSTNSIDPIPLNTRPLRQQIAHTNSSCTYDGEVDVENEIADDIDAADNNWEVQYHNDDCSICEKTDNEDIMVLCDHCHRAYHTTCLTPALTSIPDGDWKCPACNMHGQFTTAQQQKKEVFVSYPTPGEWKGQPPNRYLETYNLCKVTDIEQKTIGKHVYYTVKGVLFIKAGTSEANRRANPAGGHEYYESTKAVNGYDEVITKDAAHLDGSFVELAKRAAFRFGVSDTRRAIALTNAEQERLQRGRDMRMAIIGPIERGIQRATKKLRTGYGRVDTAVVSAEEYTTGR